MFNFAERREYKEARKASIPVLPDLIRIAEFKDFENNRYNEPGEYFYFDAPYRFEGKDYIAHLTFKATGDNYTLHYDHNLSTVEEVAALEKKSGGASLHTGETDAAAETAPTATDSTDNITSHDSKFNPTSSKNPENSSGGIKASESTDLTADEVSDLQNNEELAEEVANGLKFAKVTAPKIIASVNYQSRF